VLTAWLGAALGGVRWGLQFNPLAVMVGSVGAAALSGYPKAPRSRWFWSALLLAGAWLVGDGLSVAVKLGGGSAAVVTPLQWWNVAIMAVVSLVVGYALPAAAGAYVGRRVTHGTGWLSAMAVAAVVAGAVLAVAPALADAASRALGR
jgi:hypothetical protein